MKNRSLIYIFIALISAIFVGISINTETKIFGFSVYNFFDVGGTLFLNLLMLIVVPLISSSIITGIAKMGKEHTLGRIASKTFFIFILTNILAILLGVLLVNIFLNQFLESAKTISTIKNTKIIHGISSPETKNIFLQIIPHNILEALSYGKMLSLIFVSILFGFALTKTPYKYSFILINFFQSLFETMIQITHLIMKILPLGIFFLITKEFASTGLKALKPIALFSTVELIGIFSIFFILFPILLKFLAKINPLLHLKAMFPALITAFSTSSSSATLPLTLDCLEKRASVSNKICSLTVPLGTSLNLTATAMHIFVAASFIACVYGINLNFITQTTIFFLCLITTLGVASVPSGCLITLMIVITTLGIPKEGIGIIIVVDRFLDMLRTTTNVFGTSSNTIIIAKLEGEKNLFSKKDFN
ncbi:MAG: hypothetical protein AMS24_02650 [Chlamydiae bacterium SM23_39]|nr:MAG: hypothetical protein AMS24_02650 [Chlamydiae bacterium SM23_39]